MRQLIPLLILASLAACTSHQTPSVPAAPAGSVGLPGDEAAAIPGEPEALPPLPAERPALPSIPLEDLVGMEEESVLALIGDPDLRQDRAPARAWTYQGAACSFVLLLYPDLETNRRIVLSYEATNPEACSALMVTR